MVENKVVIMMGSESDYEFIRPAPLLLEEFGVPYDMRVSSAHKTTEKTIRIMQEYDANQDLNLVYLLTAGLSNALGGMADFHTYRSVVVCPLYSADFGGADIFSSLRNSSGVASLVALNPRNAALAAMKILGYNDRTLRGKIESYQRSLADQIEAADDMMRGKKVAEIDEMMKKK